MIELPIEPKDAVCPDCKKIYRKMSGNHTRCRECSVLHGKMLSKKYHGMKVKELDPPPPKQYPPPRVPFTPMRHLEDRFLRLEQRINLFFNRLELVEKEVGLSWRYETGRSHINRTVSEKIPAPESELGARQFPGDTD
jgi:hypothetical protein